MTAKVVVSDTNIWIDLHNSGLMHDVFRLDLEFVTTEFVLRELRKPEGEELTGLGLKVETLEGGEVVELYGLRNTLGNSSLADVSCYFLAKDRGWTLLTGDGALRRSGRDSKLEVRGVLWLLDSLCISDIVNGNKLAVGLRKMLDHGARLPKDECQKRLRVWDS